jgi:2-keto-4-pentenoate hydratase/2-oxohepta-3-ene-1,7-dioic acid hydratase in catechol pathway
MRIIRFLDPTNQIHFGIPGEDNKAELLQGDLFHGLKPTGQTVKVAKLLAPLEPRQILCIGLNYAEHARETKGKVPEFPVLFVKSIGSLQHPGDPIQLPRHLRSEEVDYEVELAVVIGKDAKNVAAADAYDYVLGYTVANDVSARDWQRRRSGGQWCRAKSFDTFCPLGPCLVTQDDIPDPHQLRLTTEVDGETLQDSNTSDMIFKVPELIEFLTGSTTLPSGTVICTGTPQGVGMGRDPRRFLQPGETVSVEIESIGRLTNPIVEEQAKGTEG